MELGVYIYYIINFLIFLFKDNKSIYPIYLTLANIPIEEQEKDENKIVVGFFPLLEKIDLVDIPQKLHGLIHTLIWHKCCHELLSPLRNQKFGNIYDTIQGKETWKLFLTLWLGIFYFH